MPVYALKPNYTGERMDRVENFGGNHHCVILVGMNIVCFALLKRFLYLPSMSFSAVMENIITRSFFSASRVYSDINWDTARMAY